MATRKVHNAHDRSLLRALHGALLDVVGMINGPARDRILIREAGIVIDRALFPLLVLVERFGPIGVVDLADRVGRDYTTVSRQLAKLESLGLIERSPAAADRRVREAVVTDAGRTMARRIDAARDRVLGAGLEAWTDGDLETFARLMRRFADAMAATQ